jgi:hypothetical protein
VLREVVREIVICTLLASEKVTETHARSNGKHGRLSLKDMDDPSGFWLTMQDYPPRTSYNLVPIFTCTAFVFV